MKKICDLVVKIKTRTHEKPYIKKVPVWGKVYKDKDSFGNIDVVGVIFFTIKDHQFCSVVKGITTHDVKIVLEDKIAFKKKQFIGHPIKSKWGNFIVKGIEEPITKYYRADNIRNMGNIETYIYVLGYEPKDSASEYIKRIHKLIKIRFTNPKVKEFKEIFEHEISKLV